MNYRIICDYCDESIPFSEGDQRPQTCPKCNSFISHLPPEPMPNAEPHVPATHPEMELVLVYQNNGQEIHIPAAARINVGRQHHGKEVLEKIPQISRIHCIIEYQDGRFRITDADSTHGTFVGVAKKDCKVFPGQILADKELVFLGREPFLVKIVPVTATTQASKTVAAIAPLPLSETMAGPKSERFRCKNCGEEFDNRTQICEKCGSWETLEAIWL